MASCKQHAEAEDEVVLMMSTSLIVDSEVAMLPLRQAFLLKLTQPHDPDESKPVSVAAISCTSSTRCKHYPNQQALQVALIPAF